MDKEVPIRAISSHMFLLWRLVALLVCLLPHACMGLQLPRALKILPAALKAPFVTRSPLAHHLFEFGTARRNRKMKAIVQQFEADSGVEIYKCDVDAKEDNRQAFLDLVNDLGERTILPMYYNRKSHSVIYGPTDYKNFKRWADGHRHYEKTPALYAYGGIEKSSFAYKLVGYAAKRIFEKAYVSTVPSCKFLFMCARLNLYHNKSCSYGPGRRTTAADIRSKLDPPARDILYTPAEK